MFIFVERVVLLNVWRVAPVGGQAALKAVPGSDVLRVRLLYFPLSAVVSEWLGASLQNWLVRFNSGGRLKFTVGAEFGTGSHSIVPFPAVGTFVVTRFGALIVRHVGHFLIPP